MKLLTGVYQGTEQVFILTADEKKAVPVKTLGIPYNTMNEIIQNMTVAELNAKKAEAKEEQAVSMEDIQKLAPIPHPLQDVICLGLNYGEHIKEAGKYDTKAFTKDKNEAIYFAKRVNTAPGDGGVIPAHEDIVSKLDYESELAVIIGKDAYNVAAEDAADYIFGYTVCNDVSARDVQTAHKQWYFGKSLEGFTPLGPVITTADDIAFPPVLNISSTVNGELRQNDTTANLIFGIDYIIHELTQGIELKAGTIIITGTPKGVGMGFDPPKFLKKGDVVTCEIEKIGSLTNTIV